MYKSREVPKLIITILVYHTDCVQSPPIAYYIIVKCKINCVLNRLVEIIRQFVTQVF